MTRYSVGGSENEYMDHKKTVLKNKKDIRDLPTLYLEEEKALARAYELLLNEIRSDTPMSAELIQHVHRRIFADLYDWAGKFRTVTISKPGVTWPPPDYLNEAMHIFERDVLSKYHAETLQSDKSFCEALGHIQGEFLAIHPFREGNARTIKLVTDILAMQSDRPALIYDASESSRNQYIEAAKAAMLQNYNPMIAIMASALKASRRSS